MRIVWTASFICAFNAEALAEPAALTPMNPSGTHNAFIIWHAVWPLDQGAVGGAAVVVEPVVVDGPRSHASSARSARKKKSDALRIGDTLSRFQAGRAPCYATFE